MYDKELKIKSQSSPSPILYSPWANSTFYIYKCLGEKSKNRTTTDIWKLHGIKHWYTEIKFYWNTVTIICYRLFTVVFTIQWQRWIAAKKTICGSPINSYCCVAHYKSCYQIITEQHFNFHVYYHTTFFKLPIHIT